MSETSQSDRAQPDGILKVLLLEDSPSDAALIERTLVKAGIRVSAKRVDERQEFEKALQQFRPDVILADYKLPHFNAAAAMLIARQWNHAVPFIVVSGAIGEEKAIAMLQAGATDYIMKDRIARLGPAVLRAVDEGAVRSHLARMLAERLQEKPVKNDQRCKILLLENNADDAQSIVSTLASHGLNLEYAHVSDEAAFVSSLRSSTPDLILADSSVPGLAAIEAWQKCQREIPEVPFILLSNVVGEDVAIDALSVGMTDYVLKNRLERLGPVVSRALSEAHERKLRIEEENRRRAAEERAKRQAAMLELILANMDETVLLVDKDAQLLLINSACESIVGDDYKDTPVSDWAKKYGAMKSDLSGTLEWQNTPLWRALNGEKVTDAELYVVNEKVPTGAWRSVSASPIRDDDGNLIGAVAIGRDITQQKLAEYSARKLLVLQRNEDFMATLTHDLKNPLLGANRIIELLLSQRIPTEQQEAILKQLLDSNRDLLRLIQKLLEVYRYDKDVDAYQFEELNIADVLSTCVSGFQSLAEDKNIKVRVNIASVLPLWIADQEGLRRVFQNLLDNAIKFTPEQGTITVSTVMKGSELVVEIGNTGPGIPSEEIVHLFERFARSTVGRRHAHGTGLGLYLCRQIVEAHGGKIHCQSNPGGVTTFTICLPRERNQTSFRVSGRH